MKYTQELWVFINKDTLGQRLHWQLASKSYNVVWCPNESWANIEREDLTILLRIVSTMSEASKYADEHFKNVVFHPHEDAFDKDVVQFLKSRERTLK